MMYILEQEQALWYIPNVLKNETSKYPMYLRNWESTGQVCEMTSCQILVEWT